MYEILRFFFQTSVEFRIFRCVFDYAPFSNFQNLLDFFKNHFILFLENLIQICSTLLRTLDLAQSERPSSIRQNHESNLNENAHHFCKICIRFICEIFKISSKIYSCFFQQSVHPNSKIQKTRFSRVSSALLNLSLEKR